MQPLLRQFIRREFLSRHLKILIMIAYILLNAFFGTRVTMKDSVRGCTFGGSLVGFGNCFLGENVCFVTPF